MGVGVEVAAEVVAGPRATEEAAVLAAAAEILTPTLEGGRSYTAAPAAKATATPRLDLPRLELETARYLESLGKPRRD